VRHLEEAVAQGLRPDLERLEEDVVLGIAGDAPIVNAIGSPV
jgi:hypothetical protein